MHASQAKAEFLAVIVHIDVPNVERLGSLAKMVTMCSNSSGRERKKQGYCTRTTMHNHVGLLCVITPDDSCTRGWESPLRKYLLNAIALDHHYCQ